MMNPIQAVENLSERQKLFLGLGLVITGYLVYKWQTTASSPLKLQGSLPITFGSDTWLPVIKNVPSLAPKKTLPPNVQAQLNADYAARQDEAYRSQLESLGGAGSMPVTSGSVWGSV